MQDSGVAAAEAHLRYVNDGEAGISRVKRGKDFTYVDAKEAHVECAT